MVKFNETECRFPALLRRRMPMEKGTAMDWEFKENSLLERLYRASP